MVQCVLPSRPSQEAGGLPPAESSRAMSSREEESGGAERHRAGVSHPASQGPGHCCTQPEVHALNIHTNRHTLISTCTAKGRRAHPASEGPGHPVQWGTQWPQGEQSAVTYARWFLSDLLTPDLLPRSRSVSGASTGLSSSPLSSPRVRSHAEVKGHVSLSLSPRVRSLRGQA